MTSEKVLSITCYYDNLSEYNEDLKQKEKQGYYVKNEEFKNCAFKVEYGNKDIIVRSYLNVVCSRLIILTTDDKIVYSGSSIDLKDSTTLTNLSIKNYIVQSSRFENNNLVLVVKYDIY